MTSSAWAHLDRSLKGVINEAFQEASRRGPKRLLPWVVLVDGDRKQLKAVKRAASKMWVDVDIVLDFIHVLGYLWDAAADLHPRGSQAAIDWVTDKARMVLNGNAGSAAGGMRRRATFAKLSKKQRENVDHAARYLMNHKPQLRYDHWLKAGYPIAAGVIEGACRYLVKGRMDLTGARWSVKGAAAVLRIRAVLICGDFEDYFEFFKRCELKRSYHTPHHRKRKKKAA